MRKLLFLFLTLVSLSALSQVKISEMTTRTNPSALWLPGVNGTTNYKILSDSLFFKKVDSIKILNGDLIYYKYGGVAYNAGSVLTDTSNKFIWNNYTSRQNANAWFRDLKLRNLKIANTDSAFLPWFDATETDGGWAYYVGKNFEVRDVDTVNEANDDWFYSINPNALIQRVTRLSGSRATAYRHNLVAAQIYETGNEGGSVYSIGGDLGSALKSYMRITNRPGQTTGRQYVQGGTVMFDAVPSLIGTIEVSPKDEALASTRRAGGYWASVTAYHNLYATDSLDHWLGFNASGYSNGAHFLSMTGLAIPITSVPTMSTLNWGVYSPDVTGGNSYNLFGGRVGIGDYNFGTHTSPTYKSSGALQINSFSRGFITSRMTATQRLAIASPDSALLVFDKDSSRLMQYDGAAWRGLAHTRDISAGGGGSGWALNGNSLTAGSATGDFIGSTNNVSMRFRTNNTERMVLDSNGSLYINTGGDVLPSDHRGLAIKALNSNAFKYSLYIYSGAGFTGEIFSVDNSASIKVGSFANLTFGAGSTLNASSASSASLPSTTLGGSLTKKYNSTATGVTLDGTYNIVEVTATGQTITLPTAVGISGRQYTIKLTASGSGTIATTSSQTIDGSTTYSLSAQYKYVTVMSNGANWIITGNN